MSLFKIWKEVFGKRKYLIKGIIIALVFYSLNIIISSWKVFTEFSYDKSFFGTINLFFFLIFHGGGIVNIYSFASLILISVLFGILFSLIFYKLKMNLSVSPKTKFSGGIGIFLAALVPGCAACGVGLISVLGLGAGALSFLPFKGLEISILAILILGFAIIKVTKEMYICKFSNSFEKMKEDRNKKEVKK